MFTLLIAPCIRYFATLSRHDTVCWRAFTPLCLIFLSLLPLRLFDAAFRHVYFFFFRAPRCFRRYARCRDFAARYARLMMRAGSALLLAAPDFSRYAAMSFCDATRLRYAYALLLLLCYA